MKPWKTLAREIILQRGKWLTVESHTIQLPDGQQISDWSWLVTPDYVNVVVIMEDGAFAFFRQTKYAVPDLSLAPVGGYLEPGEDPLESAKRELMEEMGCQAQDWTHLGQYAVDGNRGGGVAHLFLARGVRKIAERDADDLEEQELVLMSRSETKAALKAGEFKVVSWAAVVALALLYG